MAARSPGQSVKTDGCPECDRSFSTALDLGGQFLYEAADSLGVLDTGATANLVCFGWPPRRNRTLEGKGVPRVSTYPACTRFKFRGGRLGEVRHDADIPVGIAGNVGKFAAFVLGADIPAL